MKEKKEKEKKGKWDCERRDREIESTQRRRDPSWSETHVAVTERDRDPSSSNHLIILYPRWRNPRHHARPICCHRSPMETHHTHRYLLLSQKLRICACDLRIWDSQKLCLCLVHVCVFIENLCFLESEKLCLWSENLCFFLGLFGFVTLSLYVCD